jgi:cytochrome o ubiquinol oxidase operon protein cyoD
MNARGPEAPGSDSEYEALLEALDSAPGDYAAARHRTAAGVRAYLLGLALAIVLTGASFWAAQTHLIYGPGVPVALAVFAIAQMGIHLIFFLHITTAPDNTNNVLALAFGILIAALVVFGSLWIMFHLNHNTMLPDELMKLQR